MCRAGQSVTWRVANVPDIDVLLSYINMYLPIAFYDSGVEYTESFQSDN